MPRIFVSDKDMTIAKAGQSALFKAGQRRVLRDFLIETALEAGIQEVVAVVDDAPVVEETPKRKRKKAAE